MAAIFADRREGDITTLDSTSHGIRCGLPAPGGISFCLGASTRPLSFAPLGIVFNPMAMAM